MKEQIKETDIKKINHESFIFSALFISMIILPVPLFKWLGTTWIILWGIIAIVSFYYASRIEKLKKIMIFKPIKKLQHLWRRNN